jgi:stage V sporulation protein AC
MTKKPQPNQWYAAIVERNTPKKKIVRNCCLAFIGGGFLSALAQFGYFCLIEFAQMQQADAAAIVLIIVIFLTALFTGLGIYDKAAQKLGAGLAVPITGFANSVAASMMEHPF